jgi:hypothetical protein
MPQQQTDFWKPALLSGAVFGFVSGIPIVGLLNCLCCSLILSAGVLTAYLMVRGSAVPVSYGLAALAGWISAITAAVMWGVTQMLVSAAMRRDIAEEIREAAERAQQMTPEAASAARILEGIGGPILLALFTFMMMGIFSPFGVAGGLIGRAIFEKRTPPPPSGMAGAAGPDLDTPVK